MSIYYILMYIKSIKIFGILYCMMYYNRNIGFICELYFMNSIIDSKDYLILYFFI